MKKYIIIIILLVIAVVVFGRVNSQSSSINEPAIIIEEPKDREVIVTVSGTMLILRSMPSDTFHPVTINHM